MYVNMQTVLPHKFATCIWEIPGSDLAGTLVILKSFMLFLVPSRQIPE